MATKPFVSQALNAATASELPEGILDDLQLPSSVYEIYFSQAGVGLGGRFEAFRLSGPVEELQLLIARYCETRYADAPIHRHEAVSFDEYIPDSNFISRNYGVETAWLEPFRNIRGTLFRVEGDGGPVFLLDREGSRLAMIWID